MANVTYLLGAGASYNALPVVNELEINISLLLAVIDSLKRYNNNSSQRAYDNIEINITNEPKMAQHLQTIEYNLKQLQAGCKNHLSIDTYLKMLYLTGNTDYEKMKSTITLFFQLYDCLHEELFSRNKEIKKRDRVDKRYDAFLASILQNSYDEFPDTINVISWNYDNQFEKAYLRYLENAKTQKRVRELMNIYSKSDTNISIDTRKFGICKINGTASYFETSGNLATPVTEHSDSNISKRDKLLTIIDHYINSIDQEDFYKPAISFAWDSVDETDVMIETIKKITNTTETLVIIGYSFPFFNRRVDKAIIANMTKLNKIYIQDLKPKEIKDRFLATYPRFLEIALTGTPNEIIEINDINQFYLPYELTL